MISIHQFKNLPLEEQIEQLNEYAISMDVYYCKNGAEVLLFALGNFYVEIYVRKNTDEIIRLRSFTSMKKLDVYLDQVDIEEITNLLSYN
jgi:hypothetical protein